MNPSGKFFLLLLNFQKYKIQQQVHIYIYIYAFIYVGYTEKEYIEKQDALSASHAVSVKWSGTAMNRRLY